MKIEIVRLTEESALAFERDKNAQKYNHDDGILQFTGRNSHLTDEELLAQVECMALIDDERSSEAAKACRFIYVYPDGWECLNKNPRYMLRPPSSCVTRRMAKDRFYAQPGKRLKVGV